ncbi:MAG: imidazolonepropionase [Limnochordaceae bacterium]|nr:imidazolonepropionase [Limnochordaceae bacterium]
MGRADLLVRRAQQVVTLRGWSERPVAGSPEPGWLGLVEDGAVACRGDRIVAVGRTGEVERRVSWDRETVVVDAQGHAVLPGLVDPHTHAVYAGDRAEEWGRLLRGEPYLRILQSGGGIWQTVRRTREASTEDLVSGMAERLRRMMRAGATTIEVKSGYALEPEGELRLLDAIAAAAELVPAQVVPTFLGAHAVPPEYRSDPEAYVDLVEEVMLPAAARRPGLARFCDVFCEEGAFTPDQARRILSRAARLGLGLKVHADQFHPLGGARLAAEMGATSADHLDFTPREDLERLAASGTVAVLLPGAHLFTRSRALPDVEGMRYHRVPVALASDHNPGTSPVESMALVTALGCTVLGLTPEESLAGCTINAAHALALGHEVGSLEVGKRADFILVAGPSYLHLPYRMGADGAVWMVVAAGRIVAGGGEREKTPLEEGETPDDADA